MRATIKLEFHVGDDIDSSFVEATRIANLLGVNAEFQFNGITCVAVPNGVPLKGIAEYRQAIKSESPINMAFT